MNKAILIGNLANDPECRTTQSGLRTCSFRLGVQRRYASQSGERLADFLNIVCWRQTAELCEKYLHKGDKVCIEGSIQSRSYDAQDGSRRYITEIVAENVEFIKTKREGGERGAEGGTEYAAPSTPDHQMGFTEVQDDDLPF